MNRFRPYTLQSKFLLGISAVSLFIGGFMAVGLYVHVNQVLEKEVHDRATLVFTHVDAVKSYVREQLRPRMYTKFPDTFVIEAMSSSYISRSIMDRAGGGTPHVYRRVAENARNPGFEATPMEQKLIRLFRQEPGMDTWEGYRTIDGLKYYIMARPVKYRKSCLYCHGKPADAPPELVELYGDRGFGHTLDSIGGVDFVGLPVTASVARVQDAFMTYLMVFILGTVLFFTATSVIFKRVVVTNIRTLAEALQKNVADGEGDALLRRLTHGDEIHKMIAGVEHLGAHLFETRKQLKDYAGNLEAKVQQRTKELSEEHDQRKADVQLFVDLLHALNNSQSRAMLWQQALPLIAQRFDLASVSYACTFSTGRFYSWPDATARPHLPEDWVNLLTESETRIEGTRAFIPVDSSEASSEGLLCLYRSNGQVFEVRDMPMLQALGRQLGIAAENLAVLDNALRHSANLQAIFEGISDPLMLLNETGGAVIVNTAATTLAKEMGVEVDKSFISLFCGRQRERSAEGQVHFCGFDAATAAALGENLHREVPLQGGRSFVISLYPVQSAGPGKVVMHLRETTSEKKMLAQITRSEKLATVGKLSAGLAHEINNPLGVILCYGELLRKSAQEQSQVEDADVIIKHAKQAQRVLGDLLNFARPTVTTDKRIDIRAIAASVTSVFGVQAAKKNVTLTAGAANDDSVLPKVRVEPQVVEHIVANLLLNALDAVPEDTGLIEVRTHYDKQAQQVLLAVCDNGTGIAEGDMPRIFDPFFTTKDVNQGTGLGLSMLYGFMEDLGGSIEAYNQAAGGACFEVRFPVAPGGSMGQSAQEAGSAEAQAQTGHTASEPEGPAA